MIAKKIRLFSRGNGRVTEKKLDTERLSSEIDAMISCTQARLNLLRGLAELKAQLGTDDESQQLDMPDAGISSYTDSGKFAR
jgi:hypothetical protein